MRLSAINLEVKFSDRAGVLSVALGPPSKGSSEDGEYALSSHSTFYTEACQQQIKKAVKQGDARRIFNKIARLKIPAMPECEIMGLDGTTYTLKIVEGQNVAIYSWWCKPPPGWEELAKIADLLVEMAEIDHSK